MRKKPEIISNTQVKNLLKNDEFFFMSQTISHIINPIKDCILKLEARTALADGYIQMLKLAATINCLPSKFDHEAYLLSYYLHPEYHDYDSKPEIPFACEVGCKRNFSVLKWFYDELDEYDFDDDISEDPESSDYAIGSTL
ncbi:1454_t:CDS:2 [Rhizophagus irregularis]|nr:1454_t:CDS:2 [Rhizophagus irregularis]